MLRQARQKRPVAPWHREHSLFPMHSLVTLRVLQRGHPGSPHSFFCRQKWQQMPAFESYSDPRALLLHRCSISRFIVSLSPSEGFFEYTSLSSCRRPWPSSRSTIPLYSLSSRPSGCAASSPRRRRDTRSSFPRLRVTGRCWCRRRRCWRLAAARWMTPRASALDVGVTMGRRFLVLAPSSALRSSCFRFSRCSFSRLAWMRCCRSSS
mmetsp:Transcript_29995/g.63965  ORF Transcript_29995/g.63965 Transcript_29995/m.63965 type:complete len:208 (+) Transcript_29995:418-1041(+)